MRRSASPPVPESFSNLYYWRDPLPPVDLPAPPSAALEDVDEYFSSRSYVVGHSFSRADVALLSELSSNSPCLEKFPHVSRWSRHVTRLRAAGDRVSELDPPVEGREILAFIRRRVKVSVSAKSKMRTFLSLISLPHAFLPIPSASSPTRTSTPLCLVFARQDIRKS